MEALAYDLRRRLQADRATFALSPEALTSHRVDPDRVYFEILNGSSETVGMLLAVLTDPAEVDNPESLSRRMAAGHSDAPGCWAFGLAVARHLPMGDHSLCIKVMFWIPADDPPEVVSRLSAR